MVTTEQRARQDDLRVPSGLTNPYSCKKKGKKISWIRSWLSPRRKKKKESGMMFSVSDLRNVNSFVKDAQADSPAGSSSVSSALLRTCSEPGWFKTAGKAKRQLEISILTGEGREAAHRGCLHPKGTQSRCPRRCARIPQLGVQRWEHHSSSSAAPKVSPAVYLPLKTRLKINRNRLSKCGTHSEQEL